MPSFPHARVGTRVKHGGHPMRFVLYAPENAGRERAAVGRMLASNPWKCMELHLARQRQTATQTSAFLNQAYEFFAAAGRAGPISRPVLMYYGFLNLAKAIIIHKNPIIDLARSLHGITEWSDNVRQRFTLTSQKVVIQPARGGRFAVLNEFARTLGHNRLPASSEWDVCDLLSQIPAIHRPYSHTRGLAERLYVVEEGMILHDHQTRHMWATLRVRRSEFSTGQSRSRLIGRRYFASVITQVESDEEHQDYFTFESRAIHYGLSPLESLSQLCAELRKAGLVSILTPGGYRHYLSDYEPKNRVSPILAAYMAMFYFGSVARYRPLDLEKMREGKFAWVIEEMLATQGEQFLYLLASELLEREVMKPWAIQQGGPVG
jgi:hypothetical protein